MKNPDLISIEGLYRIFNKKFGLILVLMPLVALLGFGLAVFIPPGYEATSTIFINPNIPKFTFMGSVRLEALEKGAFGSEYVTAQKVLIQSYTFLEKVLIGLKREAGNEQLTVKDLSDMLKVENAPKSQLIHVTVQNRSPEAAARIANAIAGNYIEQNRDNNTRFTGEVEKSIYSKITDQKKRTDEAEGKVRTFERENDIVSKKAQMDGSILSQNNLVVAEKAALSGYRTRYTEKHPKVMDSIKKLEALEGESHRMERECQKVEELEREYQRLILTAAEEQALYNSLLQKLREIDIQSQLQLNNASILDKAQVPISASKPDKKSFTLAGLILGFILAMGLGVEEELRKNKQGEHQG